MFPRPLPLLRSSLVAVLFAAPMLAPGAAFAQEAEAGQTMYEGFNGTACEAEYQEFCKETLSATAAYNCLRTLAKREALTPACSEVTEKIRNESYAAALERHKRWTDACAGDIPKFCAEFADGKPMTIKGCLGKRRGELTEACAAALPFRPSQANKGARARWRDGTEPEDWALQNALIDRPRKTQKEIDEIGRDAWIARDKARREGKVVDGNRQGAADAAAKMAAEAAKAAGEADAE